MLHFVKQLLLSLLLIQPLSLFICAIECTNIEKDSYLTLIGIAKDENDFFMRLNKDVLKLMIRKIDQHMLNYLSDVAVRKRIPTGVCRAQAEHLGQAKAAAAGR